MVGNTSGEVDFSNRVLDTQKVPVDEDMQYTVFVIYNNYKRNLLDNPKLDMVTDRQKLVSKIPREDRWVGGCLSLLLNNCIITATVYTTYGYGGGGQVYHSRGGAGGLLQGTEAKVHGRHHPLYLQPGHTPSLT